MRFPWDDQPDAGFYGPQDPRMTAPPVLPPLPDPDYAAEFVGQQEQAPSDFWARLAQGAGPTPFGQPMLGQKPTGLEVLLAIASGFANAKATQGARRVDETTQRNQRAREAAKTLATWRHQERLAKQRAIENRELIGARAAARPVEPEPLENVIDPKTGKPVKRKRSEAAGMEPAYPPIAPGIENRGAMGLMDKIMDNVRQDPDISGFIPIRDARGVAKQAKEQADSAGDIILMRMVAKATDPTTGVREEEFRTFQGAQGVLARMGIRMTTDMVGAGQLTPGGRDKLFNTVEGIYNRKKSQHEKAKTFYRKQAKEFGLNPDLVVRDFDDAAAAEATQADVDYVKSLGLPR